MNLSPKTKRVLAKAKEIQKRLDGASKEDRRLFLAQALKQSSESAWFKRAHRDRPLGQELMNEE